LKTIDAISDRGVLAGSNTAEHAATWDPRTGRLRDLGVLPQSTTSQALAIDDRGGVTGVSRAPLEAAYSGHAFRWTRAGGLKDLGTLGGNYSTGQAINARGQVVGYSVLASGEFRGFRWTPARGMTALGALPGEKSSIATAVNAKGEAVGRADLAVSGPGGSRVLGHAVLWDPRGRPRDLGTLGGDFSVAEAVNDHGVVVGTSTTRDGRQHLFRWTRATGMRDLGTFGTNLTVRGLTEKGVIAGFRLPTGGPYERGFLYTSKAGFQDLGLPAAPGGVSFVNAMNERGTIVGALSDDGGLNIPYRNFRWQWDGGCR
jgi:probable HAF family extracellular repeat protein